MSTTVRSVANLTAEEFFEFARRPENAERRFELDEGVVVEMTNPKKLHGVVCGNATFLLITYARQIGRGQVASNESGVILGRAPDTVRGPDVAYYAERRSRRELEDEGCATTPPVVAIEVLSPDDRWRRVHRKIEQYLRAGVRMVWVLDPHTAEVTVHSPGAAVEGFGPEDILTGGDELPGFECRVSELFDLPGGSASGPASA